MPQRHFVDSTACLSERLSHLRFIESQLGNHDNHANLQHDIFKKANDVFRPFGKMVDFSIITRGELVMTFDGNQGKSLRVSNYTPEKYPQEEIVLRAGREEQIVLKKNGTEEHLAFPLFRNDEVCGMMLLSNQATGKPFSDDDLTIAREFSLIASEAMTELFARLSRS